MNREEREEREGKMDQETLEQLATQVVDAAIEVHRHLGPGLLENACEMAMCHELSSRGIRFERQVPMGVRYKNTLLDCGYRADVIVENALILELKSCEQLLPIHEACLVNYLKLSNNRIGFLINFNVRLLKNGLKRIVNELRDGATGELLSPPSRSSRPSR